MDDAGQGFEMAFYFSPMVFLILDILLLVGSLLGIIGAVAGPRWYHRVIAGGAVLACAGFFMQVTWR
jgi:hypothetical protein